MKTTGRNGSFLTTENNKRILMNIEMCRTDLCESWCRLAPGALGPERRFEP